MTPRRILCLWFPHLAVERAIRAGVADGEGPVAVVGDSKGAQVLASLNPVALRAGLAQGQPLRDALALVPGLSTHPADPVDEARGLAALARWMGGFSPWVAVDPPAGLMVDLTGCAHLFGGEAALLARIEADCAGFGLTLRAAIADTPGAAWALARFAGHAPGADRTGDAIDQEARATRARATRRRGWERGGAAPGAGATAAHGGVIAPQGRLHEVLSPLPLAALRLEAEAIVGLNRLGLRRVSDLAGLPRAALARRFGAEVLRRLDQAMGLVPEPVSPARPPDHFAARIAFPDPIGTREDIEAAIERLLPVLCLRLRERRRGARKLRLEAFRSDGQVLHIELGLAQPADAEARMLPLIALKLDQIDPGFGIDALRLEACLTEAMPAVQHRGPIDTTPRPGDHPAAATALADLVARLGARLGPESVTRLHPAQSHIPEKAAITLSAAWSDPHPAPWPAPRAPRPLVLFTPEPVSAPEGDPTPPERFRWRRREMVTRVAIGPERITPEWWLDDPAWRSGPRDYWRIEVAGGERLWLFYAHGGGLPGGWFCQGLFA